MEIWGSGCNIFGQLAKHEQPYLFELKLIQQVDKGNIDIIFNGWSEILYSINGCLKLLGFRADDIDIYFPDSILCVFGTIEISGIVDSEFNLRDLKGNILQKGIGIVVEAGNGQFVGTDYSYKNLIFFDTKDRRFDICNIFPLKLKDENSKILQISAGASHFALLLSDGEVYTWGDNIYGQLGRETSDDLESNIIPTIVSALQGLKIQKIAAGGWMTGAQSADNDLYICGWLKLGKIVNTSDNKSEFNLVDLGENVDILDFGIGSEHIVVLTTNGIYSLGKEGENCLSYSNLIWIQIPQFSNKKITHVFCSQWNTLLIAHDESTIEKDNLQS
ncbi:hypothetical protein PNEG_02676 [Pneumocystis murina B123]|uniref:Uncharacterized protein n=1 Tax=Pneumocystis murina (strain B123) TaxID=1069680 RepID=M7NJU6_PNEMU|nr:hypothetical protein PNEG_02676 [Pneumocystis murina B123]EMR08893.1 hypothetical protein PNEG_02676 [Pneumocystis murina B123]